ncbi:YbaK/EbsC family protein [Archangium violaceum]|uniref:aminoacyl-tRNA deacylase n=1 Tax=Archangium violaceum TaxID=83451 RepID=UPI00193C44BF|nr:YbaK/EbsC family protein [Archangium violaceum]QRK12727.1 YbaK/EbsC family protein [Archangium violaceum]
MIPVPIQDYLRQQHVPFLRHWHPRAITAQELAQALHVTGYRVAKSVIVRAGQQLWICLPPASETLDLKKVREALGVREVQLATEDDFANHFPDCELGAEPPFGHLYGLPVLMDESLGVAEDLLLRAGSHEEALEVSVEDFIALESPQMADIIHERPGRHVEHHAMHP